MKSKILAGLLAATMALPMAALADPQVTMAPGKGITATDSVQRKATITAIDKASRMVTLQGEGGAVFDVEVDPAVQNFDKLKVGDVVVATYAESLAVRIAGKGEGATPGVTESVSGTPSQGQRKVGHEVTATLKVEAVDAKANKVTLGDGAGRSRTINVVNPKVQERLKTLKVGDMVVVTYTESLAIKLDPLARK